MQSTAPAQALALLWCQSLQRARGQWLSCPCSTGRAPKSPACWEVWLSSGMLECHRHVSININMNCMNWSRFEGCITCVFLFGHSYISSFSEKPFSLSQCCSTVTHCCRSPPTAAP